MLLRWVGCCWLALSVGLGLWSGSGTAVRPELWTGPEPRGVARFQEPASPQDSSPQEPATQSAPKSDGAAVQNTAERQAPIPVGRELPPVRRAKRPLFQARDWDGVYFENLFREGLVGARPQPGSSSPQRGSGAGNAIAGTGATGAKEPAKSGSGAGPSPAGTWASVVPGEAIESEIKRLHLQLVQDLTTPIKFKTDYLKVRQSYSLLSMWFAIIFEYDGEVRWKQAAAIVQPACWRAAANARTDGEQAYQYARLRRDELQELIRGGAFGDSEKPIEAVDWSQVVDRVPTMIQLESSLNNLKTLTASKAEFQGSVEDVVQQAAVIAAIGKVLSNETMEGGDDEGYRDLAGEMRGGATTLLEAVKLNDFDSASSAVNRIEQSCNKCHEDWR